MQMMNSLANSLVGNSRLRLRINVIQFDRRCHPQEAIAPATLLRWLFCLVALAAKTRICLAGMGDVSRMLVASSEIVTPAQTFLSDNLIVVSI